MSLVTVAAGLPIICVWLARTVAEWLRLIGA